jgi:hypothetical protein
MRPTLCVFLLWISCKKRKTISYWYKTVESTCLLHTFLSYKFSVVNMTLNEYNITNKPKIKTQLNSTASVSRLETIIIRYYYYYHYDIN